MCQTHGHLLIVWCGLGVGSVLVFPEARTMGVCPCFLTCLEIILIVVVKTTNSYVYKNFRGVKNVHLLFGAIRLLENILLIMEQIAWVSRWFVLKKIYCQNVFVSSLTESITLQRLYNSVDMIQPMNGTVCWYNFLCFENNMTKKSNLMILDNSGINYSRMLLFVLGFLVYCKIEPNSHAFSRIWQHVIYDSISKRSHLNCQKNKMFFNNF